MEYALSESLEDYLLGIFVVSKQNKVVRLKDIAKERQVKLPSVVNALKELSEKGLISHEKYSYVTFTDKGLNEAKKLYDRHKTVFKFLHQILGVNEIIAEKDAHKMEHDLTSSTLGLLTKFTEFMEMSSKMGESRFPEQFKYFMETGKFPEIKYKEGEVMKKIKEKPLSELKKGEGGKIVRIKSGIGSLKSRLLDMGAVPGTVVRIKKVAPLGDPIDILILGYHLSLRKEEAEKIIVQEI
ncbi:MAG: metal-dependent transcriptional regulator [Caldisericota bacterium]|nr:metal-dependent transcriptional regulator [Caldisericota bacterium]